MEKLKPIMKKPDSKLTFLTFLTAEYDQRRKRTIIKKNSDGEEEKTEKSTEPPKSNNWIEFFKVVHNNYRENRREIILLGKSICLIYRN